MSATRRTVTRLDPVVRRTQIIEAAAQVFETRDPVDVPFEDIADAAGVSRALVYNYFGDRGGLLAAVYLHHFDAVLAAIRAATTGCDGVEDRYRMVVRAYLGFAAEHPGAWRLLQVARAVGHPKVREARHDQMVRLAEDWGGSPSARIVAAGFIGLLEGATIDWLEARDPDIDLTAEVVFDLVWRGLPALEHHGIGV